jgi:hypothetical protein
MRWLLVLLVGCSASDPSGPGGSSRVVQKEIPILDGGDTGNACFEVELVDPPDCVASLVPDGGEERVLPACDQDPSSLCWRIEIDLATCPGSASQRARFDNVTAADVGLVTMQCIAVDML